MFKYRKALRIVLVLISGICIFTYCTQHTEEEKNIISLNIINRYNQQYAGAVTCKKCHEEVYNNFIATAHNHTSALANGETIKGNLNDRSTYHFNMLEKVEVHKTDSGLYQTSYYNGKEKKSARFDIVIGSATLGQSYLTWQQNSLFQLPLSYYTATDGWANSPGFPESQIFFNRSVNARCLECHATFVKDITSASSSREEFDKSKIIYGVTCENCHGSAAQHVAYHTKNSEEKTARFIVNPAKFTAARQLDNCALCHSGMLQNTKPSFSFLPGDTLLNYFQASHATDSASMNDVHGNKFNLLIASRCYKESNSVTCSTCHNVHNNERDNLITFSQRCMNCHSEAKHNFCKLAATIGAAIKTNCIDCHMPSKPSTVLTVQLEQKEKQTPAYIRTHLIKVYPEETSKVLSYLKKVKG